MASGALVELEELVTLVESRMPEAARPGAFEAGELPFAVRALARVRAAVDRAVAVTSAAIAHASEPEAGHDGLAQRHGFSEPAKFVQSLTGASLGVARQFVDVGRLLTPPTEGAREGADASAGTGADVPPEWGASLTTAVVDGLLSVEQADAALSGVGQPTSPELEPLWSAALEALVADAVRFSWTVEEIRRNAKRVHVRLDAEIVAREETARFTARSLRRYRRADGMTQYTLLADPESAAQVDAALDAALSPRRFGPRFVEVGAAEAAAEVSDDPRSYEQHAFDVFLAILRSGIAVDAGQIFTTASPEVHIVVTREELRRAAEGEAGVAHLHGNPNPIPAAAAVRSLCTGSFVTMLFDRSGAALDVGRVQRLFPPAQRRVLAARDGGCMFPGCERPPSHCEAHHLTPWSEGGGTSLDNGILLCRYHHLHLHNSGSRIERDDGGVLWLHRASTGEVVELRSKSAAMAELRLRRTG